MPPEPLLAGVELGGTKTIIVLSRGKKLLHSVSVPTGDAGNTLAQAAAQLKAWNEAESVAALGIASFGPLQLDASADRYGHMLPTPKPDWSGVDIYGALTSGLSCPAVIDTDVNGAALAECWWGAGAHVEMPLDSLCYITIGTGLGGGLIVAGKPVHGAMHPEMGHIRVRRAHDDPFPGVCPFHGDCIEGLVSGPALAARFKVAAEDIDAADPRWAHVENEVAELLCTILLTTSARMVLIGGGVGMAMGNRLNLIGAKVVDRLAGYLPFVNKATIGGIIRRPALGAQAGPMGAIALAWLAFDNI